jgi:hypothetical protein
VYSSTREVPGRRGGGAPPAGPGLPLAARGGALCALAAGALRPLAGWLAVWLWRAGVGRQDKFIKEGV